MLEQRRLFEDPEGSEIVVSDGESRERRFLGKGPRRTCLPFSLERELEIVAQGVDQRSGNIGESIPSRKVSM
jgi:hypothetical protein